MKNKKYRIVVRYYENGEVIEKIILTNYMELDLCRHEELYMMINLANTNTKDTVYFLEEKIEL